MSPLLQPDMSSLTALGFNATSNVGDPDSRAWQVHIAAIVCGILVLVAIIIQLYTRRVVLGHLGLDDYISILAAVIFTFPARYPDPDHVQKVSVFAYVGLVVLGVQQGYGRHIWDNTSATFTNRQQYYVIISNCIYGPTIFLIKLSLFILLYKIFGPLRWVRLSVWSGIISTFLFYISIMAAFIALCNSREQSPSIEISQTPQCQRTGNLEVAQAVFDILSDCYLLAIPITCILRLQLPTHQKLGILAIFMTGLLAILASCLSLHYQIKFNSSTDVTWDAIDPIITSMVEMSVGIAVGMMPIIPALMRHLHEKPRIAKIFDGLSLVFGTSARVSSKDAARQSNETPDFTLTSPSEQRITEGELPRLHIELPTRWPTWREYGGILIKVNKDVGQFYDYYRPYKPCNCPAEHKGYQSGDSNSAATPSETSSGLSRDKTEAQPAASLYTTPSRILQDDNRDSSICPVDHTMLSISTVPHKTDCISCSTFIARTK